MKLTKFMSALIGMAVAVIGAGAGTRVAMAAPKSGPFYTSTMALANAPQGTPMDSYFTFPTNSTVKSNSAKVVSATSPVSGLTNNAVQITPNATSQTGAVWSTNESFNLYKNQTASMWIFVSGAKQKTPGDGMAFVLQNAGDTNQFSDNGEALGVWGVDPKSTTASSDTVASTAIAKSWALEFDTYKNDFQPTTLLPISAISWNLDDSAPSSFELGNAYQSVSTSGTGTQATTISGAHIASNYPGDAGTYQVKGPNYGRKSGDSLAFPSKYYYYGMNHLGYIPTGSNLADNEWHHITLNYQAPTATGGNGTMTYSYNDKNPQTGVAQTASDTRTVPLDLSKFKLASGQTNIRWGFTGSTGEVSESNLVVFDQIPGQTKTTASANMTYEKDGKQVTVNNNDQIPGAANIALNYTAQRQSGDADWKDVNAEIKVPDNINLNGTAKITYSTGATRTATVTKQSDGYVQVNLAQADGDSGLTLRDQQAVKVTLNGKTRNPTSGTISSGSDLTSYFKGTNAVSTVASPAFTVVHSDVPALNLVPDQSIVHVNLGEDPIVTGKVVSSDGSALVNNNLTLRSWLVNAENGNTLLPDVKLSDDNPASGFKLPIPAVSKGLKPGKYTLTLEAMDTSSNLATATITIIIGHVAFGETSGDLNFTAPLTGNEQTVQRADSDWSFNIDDSLTAGSDWKLYAKATTLASKTTPGTTLDGQLIYSDGTDEQPLSTTVNTLITDHKSDGTTMPFNVASDWNRNSGILLKVNGGAHIGQYQGTITWTLSNTP